LVLIIVMIFLNAKIFADVSLFLYKTFEILFDEVDTLTFGWMEKGELREDILEGEK
jgi:hypothetical protein